MDASQISKSFDFSGQTFLVTGGAGVSCTEMAIELSACGTNSVIRENNLDKASATIQVFPKMQSNGKAIAVQTDVHKAQEFSSNIRVDANAPSFFNRPSEYHALAVFVSLDLCHRDCNPRRQRIFCQ
jgi:hypothetical protein